MRTYEVLFILHPHLTEEESTNLIAEFRDVAEKNGMKITSEDAWGRRRFAYPIDKQTEGIYHLFLMEGEAEPAEVDRRMKNSDRVMRHMIVRTDVEMQRQVKLAAKREPKKAARQAQLAARAAQAQAAASASAAAANQARGEEPAAE